MLICDYFSKFTFFYKAKSSFGSLRDCLMDLFAVECHLDDIVSDNSPPFNSKEFSKLSLPWASSTSHHHHIILDQMAS